MDIIDYKKIEKKFFQILRRKFGSKLILYCLVGSLARDDIVASWSDIDILLVFDTVDAKAMNKLRSALKATKTTVKIGLTFYNLREFNDILYKDPKTYQIINLICQNIYKPRLISDKIKLEPNYNTESFDNVDISKAIHSIKRELVLGAVSYNENKVTKLIFMILKIYLRNRKIYALGYEDIINKTMENLDFNISLPTPDQIIHNSNGKRKRYLIYCTFLNWVSQHQYWTN